MSNRELKTKCQKARRFFRSIKSLKKAKGQDIVKVAGLQRKLKSMSAMPRIRPAYKTRTNWNPEKMIQRHGLSNLKVLNHQVL